jgi:hypothetical protein
MIMLHLLQAIARLALLVSLSASAATALAAAPQPAPEVSAPGRIMLEFESVMPNRHVEAATLPEMECEQRTFLYCSASTPNSAIVRYVRVDYDAGRVRRVQFAIREGALTLGALAVALGMSSIDPTSGLLRFDTERYRVLVSLDRSGSGFHAWVTSINITAADAGPPSLES